MENVVNWSAISAMVSVVTLVGVVGVGGIMWGKLTERVKVQGTAIADHDDRFDVQDEHFKEHTGSIHEHDGRLIRLEEWRHGYECGRRGTVEQTEG
jgi:hypothetical protein